MSICIITLNITYWKSWGQTFLQIRTWYHIIEIMKKRLEDIKITIWIYMFQITHVSSFLSPVVRKISDATETLTQCNQIFANL